ncbi:MAG: transcription antitermination factor NusB, partial [Alphaproteobacteria bacterium]
MSEGLFTRIIALDILQTIIRKKQNLDDSFENKATDLPPRDKAFIRMLITTTLRRMGQIDDILKKLL